MKQTEVGGKARRSCGDLRPYRDLLDGCNSGMGLRDSVAVNR